MSSITKSVIDIPLNLFGREAVRSLSRNKLRSTLSAIGITIGIAAVVCVVAIGTAGSQRAEQQLQNFFREATDLVCQCFPMPSEVTAAFRHKFSDAPWVTYRRR
jgi:hypothetical protein